MRFWGREFSYGELEFRAAVQGDEFLSFELECGGHHHSRAPRRFPWEVRDVADFRVLENGGVEIYGFFSVVVEPQERRDFLDGGSSSRDK